MAVRFPATGNHTYKESLNKHAVYITSSLTHKIVNTTVVVMSKCYVYKHLFHNMCRTQ